MRRAALCLLVLFVFFVVASPACLCAATVERLTRLVEKLAGK